MNPDILRQFQEMQRRAEEMQKNLAAMEVEGISGGGMIRAVMNGLGELKSISIDPSLMHPNEHKILEDLVVAACNDGKTRLDAKRAQESQFFTDMMKGLGLGGS